MRAGCTSNISDLSLSDMDVLLTLNERVCLCVSGRRLWQQESRYARTGKYRQHTQDINLLFVEVVFLSLMHV